MKQMSNSSTCGQLVVLGLRKFNEWLMALSRTTAIYEKIAEKLESTRNRPQCEECQTKLSTLHPIFINILPI